MIIFGYETWQYGMQNSVAQDFVMLSVMCAFLVQGCLQGSETWEVVEFFAGKGRLSRLAAKVGFPVASFELELDNGVRTKKNKKKRQRRFPKRSYMDFNGEAGFALL